MIDAELSRSTSVETISCQRQWGVGTIILVLFVLCLTLFGAGRFQSSSDIGSAIFLLDTSFHCCGRGLAGNQGRCLLAAAGSVCCAGEIPLLCSAGNTGHLNKYGHPYCCAPGTYGCGDVCVDPNRRNSILMGGGTCNDVAPQGLATPGRIQYLGIPWDGQLRRYRFGMHTALIDVPLPAGIDDFTIAATITPLFDNRTAFESRSVGALMQRRDNNTVQPYALFIGFDDTARAVQFLTPSSFLTAPYGSFIRANMPVEFLFIRSGTTHFIYGNGTLLASMEANAYNLDDSLQFPLEVGLRIFRNIDGSTSDASDDAHVALNAYVSDMSISRTADVPSGSVPMSES